LREDIECALPGNPLAPRHPVHVDDECFEDFDIGIVFEKDLSGTYIIHETPNCRLFACATGARAVKALLTMNGSGVVDKISDHLAVTTRQAGRFFPFLPS